MSQRLNRKWLAAGKITPKKLLSHGLSRYLPQLRSGRNVYWYYKEKDGLNFGDWIGPYIYQKMTGRTPIMANPSGASRETTLYICGSILGHIKKDDCAIVWGAGAIQADLTFRRPNRILAVRGPLTRQLCLAQGYDCPEVMGDPGLLLPRFYQPTSGTPKAPLGLIPHYKDLPMFEAAYGGAPGIRIIDVRRPVEEVVDDICACEATVSTSLHGLIVSHAYGIPTAWGVASENIIGGPFKYRDYYLGAGFQEPSKPIDLTRTVPQQDLVDLAKLSPGLPAAWSAEPLLACCPIPAK